MWSIKILAPIFLIPATFIHILQSPSKNTENQPKPLPRLHSFFYDSTTGAYDSTESALS
jgi:hypothetical protein